MRRPGRNGGKVRVLVVEDSPDIGAIFMSWLSTAGHRVILWTNRFEDLLSPEPWDGVEVAIVDLMLGPGISGAAILAYLEADQPQVRRVVCSALPIDDSDINGGAHAVLVKPVKATQLLEALR